MITIRQAVLGDLYHVNAIYNHFIEHSAITFDVEPWSIAQRLQWYQTAILKQRHILLVAVQDDKVIGFAYNGTFKAKQAYASSTEVTVYKAPDCEERGVGRALYRHLLNALKSQDFNRAYAWITLPNDASIALHHNMGFETVGTMGQVGKKFDEFHDVALLEKVLTNETEQEPA